MSSINPNTVTQISQQHIDVLERRTSRVEALTAFMLNHHELTGDVDSVLFEMLVEETQLLSSSIAQIPTPVGHGDISF